MGFRSYLGRRLDRYVATLSSRLADKVLTLSARHYPELPEDLIPAELITKPYIRRRLLFFVTVGQGISAWATMEGVLVDVAARLLGTTPEKTGLVLYSINNFNVWLGLISELMLTDDRTKPFRSKWTLINERLRGLNDTRVRLAHHSVGSMGDDYEPFLRANPLDIRSKTRKQKPLIINGVVAFTDKVVTLTDDLIQLRDALKSAIAAPESGPHEVA